MLAKSLLNPILANEGLTRHLRDPEARILVEWLVEQAERLAANGLSTADTEQTITRLCLRARAISRFVGLWCHQGEHAAAYQLAGVERFTWPFPEPAQDPCELMQSILDWEEGHPPL